MKRAFLSRAVLSATLCALPAACSDCGDDTDADASRDAAIVDAARIDTGTVDARPDAQQQADALGGPDASAADIASSDAAHDDAGTCGACTLEPGDVIALREVHRPTPELGTPEYRTMADACPVIVLDRALPPDPSATFNHTILITEGGTLDTARFIQATDPGGVFEATLGDWIDTPQTACGWQFVYAEVYRRPASYVVSAAQAVANARSYSGETYALVPNMLATTTWAHFRDDAEVSLWDIITYEGVNKALALLGEIAWDFTVGGYTQDLYSQPRFCGLSKSDTVYCGGLRRCNVCVPPGQGTKYCSELIWWSYGGVDGVHAAGTLQGGVNGQVPDLFVHQDSIMTAIKHETDDLQYNFVVKCRRAPIRELRLVDAGCP